MAISGAESKTGSFLVSFEQNRYLDTCIRYLPLLILAVAWEASTRLGLVSKLALPPLSRVLASWYRLAASGELFVHGANSLYRTAVGLACAVVAGTVLGILMGWSRLFDTLLGPLVRMFYPMPKSALIPMMALWLGFGDGSKIVLIALGCTLPVAISAYNGARGAERTLIWSARALGASRIRTLFDVVVPSALHELLSGIRIALATSFILLVSLEFIAARKGLGFMIGFLGEGGVYDAMFAAVLTVALLGFIADRLYLMLMRRLLRWRAARFITPALLIVLWETLVRDGTISSFMLPPLSGVLVQIGEHIASGELFVNLAMTLFRTFTGFTIAAIGGIFLGLAVNRSRLANWFFDPIVSVGFPMPKIAFLPVFIRWFGLYDGSKITIIAVSAIFPVITATLAGLQGVERELLWSARSLGASARRASFEIAIPAALPQILTGLQVALLTALIVAVIAEMMMGGFGLGGMMMESSRQLDSTGVFAGIVETAITGHVVISLMSLARRRLLRWHQETQEMAAV